MMPILFTALFGYTITTEVDEIKLAILDNDYSSESRALVSKFAASNYFKPYAYVNTLESIEKMIDSNTVKSALIIPHGFSDLGEKKEEALLIIDGSDPTVAQTALQSGSLIANVNSVSDEVRIKMTEGSLNTKVWYNPNLESTNFIVPGLIGIVMQNITIILTAFSLVRERERGNLELLIVSPIKPSELIIGKMIPYISIGFIDFLIALFLGTQLFSIPIRGSLLLLMILGFVFVITALSIGMLISTVAKNQLQAMQITFIILLPTILLSGFMFPIEAMPPMVQNVSKLLPATYFIIILRGIILKGTSFNLLITESLVLVLFSFVLLLAAIKKFHKSLD
jgi:ABC-2 type transport system permease protein